MKKRIAALLLIAAALSLCACGGKEAAAAPDMQAVYEKLMETEGMPEMITVPADVAETLLGIAPADCKQAVAAICQISLQTDEIWLVEAVDAAAAGRIAELAKARVEQKSAELEHYLPEQYKVVQQARIISSGNCVVLLISPQVEQLAAVLKDSYGLA